MHYRHIISCALIIICVGYRVPLLCAADNPQEETFKLLDKWYTSGSPKIRRQIEQASGPKEILASRIMTALRNTENQKLFKASWAELLRNEKLTMIVLYPVITTYLHDKSIEADHDANCYISLLSEIAELEEDGTAFRQLKKITKLNNAWCKQWQVCIDALQTENIIYQSKQYRDTKKYKYLQWVVERLFPNDLPRIRNNPLLRDDIIRYLGNGVKHDEFSNEYTAMTDFGIPVTVVITFSDTLAVRADLLDENKKAQH